MIVRNTILHPFTSMREAYAAVLDIEAKYLKTHRKKHTIELTLTSTSTPVFDDRGRVKLTNEVIEVRAVYDDKAAAQVAEYEWFSGVGEESLV